MYSQFAAVLARIRTPRPDQKQARKVPWLVGLPVGPERHGLVIRL
ncbi:MAG: hypothetical protein V7L21_10705 [Nostoc sp.]|nr:hypothetical protein [Nostoc sp. NMS9]